MPPPAELCSTLNSITMRLLQFFDKAVQDSGEEGEGVTSLALTGLVASAKNTGSGLSAMKLCRRTTTPAVYPMYMGPGLAGRVHVVARCAFLAPLLERRRIGPCTACLRGWSRCARTCVVLVASQCKTNISDDQLLALSRQAQAAARAKV